MLALFFLKMHLLAGYVCCIVATIILFLKKGNARHKMLGQIFSIFGIILCATAAAVLIDLALHKEYLNIKRDAFSFHSTSFARHHLMIFVKEYFAMICINLMTLYLIVTGWIMLRLSRPGSYAKRGVRYFSLTTLVILMCLVGMFYFVVSHDIPVGEQKGNIMNLLLLIPYGYYVFTDVYRFVIKSYNYNRQMQIASHLSRMLLAFSAVITAFLIRLSNYHIHFFHWIPVSLIFIIMLFYHLKIRKKI